MGPDEDEGGCIGILNGVISLIDTAIADEVDQRRAEVILDQLQLTEAGAASSPGTREDLTRSHSSESPELRGQEASKYRLITDRLSYLALDRPDIPHAIEGATKDMARPKEHHWNLARSMARYFIDAPRVIQSSRCRSMISTAVGMRDSDRPGDQTQRKSTSGGVCRMVPYVGKIRSSIQQMMSLSSAEAELYAFPMCSCQTLGVVNLALGFGITLNAIAHADASGALAITQGQGLGKLRHIAAHWLQIQERGKHGEVPLTKHMGQRIQRTSSRSICRPKRYGNI